MNVWSRFARSARTLCKLPKVVATLALSLLLLSGVLGQTLDPRINTQSADALRVVAQHISPSNDYAQTFLERLDFPLAHQASFQRFPVIRKIEAAYISAELARKGDGERMLALLSADLANQYGTIYRMPELVRYTAYAPKAQKIQFVSELPSPAKHTVPGHVREAITAISPYCEGNAFGGVHNLLQTYVGLDDAEAYQILRSSRSVGEALQRGLSRVHPERQYDVMVRLVGSVDNHYPTALRERKLDPFRPKRYAYPFVTGPSNGPGHGPQSGGGGGGTGAPAPGGSDSRVQEYESFLGKTPYSEVTSGTRQGPRGGGGIRGGSFGRVIGRSGGFGGVVFGNDVTIDSGLGKLESIRWIPIPSDTAKCLLAIKFSRQTRALAFGPVLREDAYAAQQIVFSRDYGNILPWQNESTTPTRGGKDRTITGQSIGLAGMRFDTSITNYDIDADRVTNDRLDRGRRVKVMLHPALLDSSLGTAAGMIDMLPQSGQLEADARSTLSQSSAEAIARWAKSRSEIPNSATLMGEVDNYKFIDAPLRIMPSTSRTSVVVSRRGSRGEAKDILLSVQSFREVLSDSEAPSILDEKAEFTTQFVSVFPALAKISSPFDRMNQFAAVLALYRVWKADGGNLSTAIALDRPPLVRTPGSFIITDGPSRHTQGVVQAPGYGLKETEAKRIESHFYEIKPGQKVRGNDLAFWILEKPDASSMMLTSAINTPNDYGYKFTKLVFDVKPRVQDGKVLAPVRPLLEGQKYAVKWDKNQPKLVAVSGEEKSITFEIGVKSMQVAKGTNALPEEKPLEKAPFVEDGRRTVTSVTFLRDATGARVLYDDKTGRVFIVVDKRDVAPEG